MAFLGLIPLLAGLGLTMFSRLRKKPSDNLSTPNYASTEVLLSQEEIRRRSQNRKGRRSTDITGGLTGQPSLGRGALWPI